MKKEKKRKTPPVDMSLPCPLALALDDVGTGAILKRLSDGRKSVTVDYVIEGVEGWIVAYVTNKALLRGEEDGKLPSKTKDYEFCLVEPKDYKKWIVLHFGTDKFVLID